VVLFAAVAVYFGIALYPIGHHHYMKHRYPAIKEKPRLGDEIVQSMDVKRRREFESEYTRIWGLLDAAEGLGFEVSYLRPKMAYAAQLAQKQKYKYAGIILNTVEVRIPRKHEPIVVAGPDDVEPEAPRPKRKARGRRRRRR